MKPNRIVLALALASLAAPALAEKCHYCDFSDEPIIVTPKKAAGLTPLDSPAATGQARQLTVVQDLSRQHQPLVMHKRIDKSTPLIAQGLAKNERPTESLSLNFTKIEYKHIPLDAKGPAKTPAGGMSAVRR
jgi:hypothetical protein